MPPEVEKIPDNQSQDQAPGNPREHQGPPGNDQEKKRELTQEQKKTLEAELANGVKTGQEFGNPPKDPDLTFSRGGVSRKAQYLGSQKP